MDRPMRKMYYFTKNHAIQLIDKRGPELLKELNSHFAFWDFLEHHRNWSGRDDDFELLVMVVQILSQACCIKGRKDLASLRKLLRMVKERDNFLFNDVPEAISMCLYEKRQNINIILLLAQYMIILNQIMKNYAVERIVDEIYPSLQNFMNFVKEKRIRNLEVASEQFIKLGVEVEKYQKLHTESEDDEDLVQNFRKLSVVPRNDDIINCEIPGLSPNIIDQPYKSVTHYLSVYYRLMREDMLRSFRGISKYIQQCDSGQHGAKGRLFESVLVDHPPMYTPSGICYNIRVITSKEIDFTKRDILMPGNLVCFTADSFHSVVFATITENPRAQSSKSRECRMKVKLEDDLCRDELKSDITYLMIEPAAYFESYRHILSSIKEFSEDSFPLSDIIAYLDYEDPEPDYLQGLQYCLHEKCGNYANQENNESHPCKIFDPLLDNEWPTADELKLDHQQFEAFRTALTKKVAIIQGPPGTGKTYVGVKVVKALLDNVPHKPIIVSCLTNHALDQFLERILKHTKKVVRLGSQSKSEILEPHYIQNMLFAVQKFFQNFHYSSSCTQNDKILEKSLDLIKSISPLVLNKNLVQDIDEDSLQLIQLCHSLNKLINTRILCNDKYLSDTALNEIIPYDSKMELLKGSGTSSTALSTSTFEWLCCSRSSDLYEKCRKQFRRIMQQTDFTDTLPADGKDLWSLTEYKRYELFYYWRVTCLQICEKNVKDMIKEYTKLLPRCSHRVINQTKLEILKKADIVGVTTTGAAKFRDLIKYCEPRIIVVEEAAQLMEAHVLATLTSKTQHLILIGDHEQLRPIPADHDLSENYNLKISMFERLFTNDAPSATLVTQHRMKPSIAELLVPKPYLILHSDKSVYEYEEIKGVLSSVFFLTHSEPESAISSGSSASNNYEARMIVSLTKYFLSLSYSPSQITILSAYAAQVLLIHKYLKEENVEVHTTTTVDNYQGEENDIVLVSFVRSSMSIGYLKESNRVCVALSRAKKGMFCVGNFKLFSSKNQLWNTIVQKLTAKNMIGELLPLKCSRHEKTCPTRTPDDILEFIRHGCGEKCDFILSCGHTCIRKCHFVDMDHVQYCCKMPCTKYIDETRLCPRMCFERCKRLKVAAVELPCGHFTRRYISDSSLSTIRCEEEMQKHLPCGHLVTIPCYINVFTYHCRALVPIELPCGHRKNILCHQQSQLEDIICNEMRPEVGLCDHTIDVPCSIKLLKSELLPFCTRPCDMLLSCGHPCVGDCRWCFDFGIHTFCMSRCELNLSCGHQCGGYCGSPCIPCEKKCFLSCPHSAKCCNLCSRPCIKCSEPCARQCVHVQCTKLCYEMCDVEPCREACDKVLPCGHECIGLCGDPCPYLCRVCHPDELKSGSLHYIMLEDCDHLIEMDKMDAYVEECLEALEWPSCPECLQVITKSGRYKGQLQKAKNFCLQSADTTEELDLVRYSLHAMYYGKVYLVPARFLDIHRKISEILDKDKPTSASLLVLKRCVMCLSKLLPISSKLEESAESDFNLFLENRLDTLLLWICRHLTHASFQQLHELESEVNDLCEKVLREFNTSLNIPVS